ncbi:hypothetical protein ACF1CG_24090 [Streptomyces sp. NPDC014773]|uniref:hypothetical protein n=1 Tax=Streptomyces sp. NPDC014773 TaxID=3364908 RepID=UPI0036FA87BD
MSEDSGAPVRHRDRHVWLVRFTDRVLVVCPRCGGRAHVVPRPDLAPPRWSSELLVLPRRMACTGCGAVREWTAEPRGEGLAGAAIGGTEDPFFRLPLWLQARCAGRVLWAYNGAHVEELSGYVGARLRERGSLSPTLAMIPRLPAWMKRAGNRSAVLAALNVLRTLADAEHSTAAHRSDAAHPRHDRPRYPGSLFFRGGAY